MGGYLSTWCQNDTRADDSKETNMPLVGVTSIKTQAESERKILSFKDFKGFKRLENIHDFYTLGHQLGKGSFGEVRKARHLKAGVDCAMKIIRKCQIEQHQILVDLMHNELKVLEETVRIVFLL